MFHIPTTRLCAIKFLGLFGGGGSAIQSDITNPDNADQADIKTAYLTKSPPLPPPPAYNNSSQAPTLTRSVLANEKDPIESSIKKVVAVMLESGIPGLTICVSKRGNIVWHSAFGYCDVENQLECKPEARMRIASISKSLFAATIIGPMLEQNKLNLKDSIHQYLTADEFPKKKYADKDVDITVEQLLAHTSGVIHYAEEPDDTCRPVGSPGSKHVYQRDSQYDRTGYYQRKTYRNVIDALEPFKDEPLASEPGKFKYTTNGYVLLSAVAEKAHQKAASDDKSKKEQIEDFWQKVLHRDWKLTETTLDQDEPILSNRARYYLRAAKHGGLVNAPYTDNSVKWAGGGIVSSANDLVKFGNSLIDAYKGKSAASGKLKRETIELLWKEVGQNKYGLGFSLEALDSRNGGGDEVAIYHTGVALGASSVLVIYPKAEIVVAILTNLGWQDMKPLGLHVANQFSK